MADDLDRFLRSLGIGPGSEVRADQNRPDHVIVQTFFDPPFHQYPVLAGVVRSLRRNGIPAWGVLEDADEGELGAVHIVVQASDQDRAPALIRAYLKRVSKRPRRQDNVLF